MAPFFGSFQKRNIMPNQGNKSNGRSNPGAGQKKHLGDRKETQEQPNPERSDIKQGRDDDSGSTNRTSNEGRKTASGGSAED
jgi:hypothetical protein